VFLLYLDFLGICAISAILLWLISLAKKDVSFIDACWSLFYVVFVWLAAFHAGVEELSIRQQLIILIVSIWGVRLSIYLLYRNWRLPEDPRYRAMRDHHGKQFWWVSLFTVFLLQSLLAWLISSTLLAGIWDSGVLSLLDYLAFSIWLVGFIFEAGSDLQLAIFKNKDENKGKLLTSGFWRYTRHPNYFGDAACWWGYALFALAAGNWWGIFGSLLMTFLLVRVSGVSLLEKSLVNAKPGYQEYAERTSAFIPWFPK
jgi:steroid 5-alpha reductase family enzyme